MDAIIIDACCLINLYTGATGSPTRTLETLGDLYVPVESRIEAQRIRKRSPNATSGVISAPLDLRDAVSLSLIHECRVEGPTEQSLFVTLSQRLGDGEAACIAIGWSRGWVVATDDMRASRIAVEQGVPTVTTPELLRMWVDGGRPTRATIAETLSKIEQFARYRPPAEHALRSWWDGFLRLEP